MAAYKIESNWTVKIIDVKVHGFQIVPTITMGSCIVPISFGLGSKRKESE